MPETRDGCGSYGDSWPGNILLSTSCSYLPLCLMMSCIRYPSRWSERTARPRKEDLWPLCPPRLWLECPVPELACSPEAAPVRVTCRRRARPSGRGSLKRSFEANVQQDTSQNSSVRILLEGVLAFHHESSTSCLRQPPACCLCDSTRLRPDGSSVLITGQNYENDAKRK